MTKLTIKSEVLNKIFEFVSPGIEARTSNKYAKSFLVQVFVDKMVVRTNNSLIEATYTYDGVFEFEGEPIVFCVEQFIYQIISKMKGDIVFNFLDNKVELTNKKSKHHISTIDPDKFPEKLDVPEETIKIVDIPKFCSLFKSSEFAVSTLPDNEILQTFNVTAENGISVTNKQQALMIKSNLLDIESNIPGKSFIVGLKGASELKPDDTFEAAFNNTIYLKYQFENGVLEYIITPIEGTYPTDIKDLFEKAESSEVVFQFVAKKEDVLEALDIALIYYTKAGATGDAQFLTIKLENGNISFLTGVESISESVQNVETISTIGAEASVNIDPKDLLDYIQLVQGDVVVTMYNDYEDFIFCTDSENPDIRYIQTTMDEG